MATDGTETAETTTNRGVLDYWNDLSLNSRVALVGLVGAVLVVIGFGVTMAGQGDVALSPLLAGDFTPVERSQALKAFSQAGLKNYVYDGATILVPSNEVPRYLAALSENDALPGNFYKAIDDYITNQRTWWASQTESERLFSVAKERMLASAIETFPDISNALVTVTQVPRYGLRRTGIRKASVKVTTIGNKPLGPMVAEEIKNLVGNAFSDLTPARVEVVGGGMAGHNASSGDGDTCVPTELAGMKNELLQNKVLYARCIEDRIRRMLSYMRDVEVVVNVEVENERNVQQRLVEFDKGAVKEQDTSQMSSSSRRGGPAQGEPGVPPNVIPPGVPNQGASASVSTQEDTEEESNTSYDNNQVETTKQFQDFPIKSVGVVINVPRSYLDATDNPVDPTQISEAVASLGFPGLTADTVRIVPFTAPEPEEVTEPSFSVIELLVDNGRSLTLGLFGLVAVIVAALIARRAIVPPLPEIPELPAQDDEGTSDEDEDLLPQVETSEQQKRVGQMKTSIQQLVDSDPDSAAAIVRRWVQSE
ncbi:flagellar MS-ring protein [Planctomycetes bacterium Pan216]|uniref:Flagellar MS-ring protein n=1 Tax=Kolteria novifilia TaxID=2527975 RepID=A0A518B536_9BACT|nr:flagellar MS-ring protein [Planctomycetes bacterium Pan216]